MLDPDRVTLRRVLQGKEGAQPPVVSGGAIGTTVRQALRLMSLHDVSQLPVMDRERCVGLGDRLVTVGQEPGGRESARRDGE